MEEVHVFNLETKDMQLLCAKTANIYVDPDFIILPGIIGLAELW